MTALATQPEVPTRQGVHKGVPDPTYRAVDALSQSKLKAWVAGEEATGRQLIFGTAFHTRVFFGKEALARDYIKATRDYDLRTREGKDSFIDDDETAASRGKGMLLRKECDLMGKMLESMSQSPIGKRVLEFDGDKEVAVLADKLIPSSKFTGYNGRVKCLIDIVKPNGLWDLKTTGYRDSEQFANAVVDYGYNVQDYAYSEIYANATGNWLPFGFICVSKQPPYCVWTTVISPEMRAAGGKWWHDMLNLYERSNNE